MIVEMRRFRNWATVRPCLPPSPGAGLMPPLRRPTSALPRQSWATGHRLGLARLPCEPCGVLSAIALVQLVWSRRGARRVDPIEASIAHTAAHGLGPSRTPLPDVSERMCPDIFVDLFSQHSTERVSSNR